MVLTEKRKEQIRVAMDAIDGLGPAEWEGDAFAEAVWPKPSGVARVGVVANNAFPGDTTYAFEVGFWPDLPPMNSETQPESWPSQRWSEEQFEEGLAQAIDELRKLLLR